MILREAQGRFPFEFWVEKATVIEREGKMIVEGIASTGNVDHDGERMAPEALKAMVDVVNERGVPLRIEHSQKDHAIVGEVNKGWLDERGQFHIQAELDPGHVASPILYNALKSGGKYGLSVGGFVKRAAKEMVEGVGRAVKTFYDIVLDEVSITQHPSNYDAIGLKALKSRIKPEGDYLEAFAKSIPANEWKDYKLVDKDMKTKAQETDTETTEETKKTADTDTETTETKKAASDETTEETTKSVSRKEFGELTKMVSEGFNAITSVLSKAISVEAKDKRQPSEDKETPEGQKRDVTKMGNDAVDQRQPDKKKEDPEATQEAAVTKAEDTTEEDTKTTKDANGTDTDGERETTKAAKKESSETETYDLTTVQRSIKRIQAVAKAMDTETETQETTKAATDTDTETETKTTKSVKISSMDQFAATVADTIERMEKSLKNSGFQTDHIAKAVIENIRSNSAYQEDIKSMLREPGQKRSVVMGTPFVKTRDGRMYKLTIENHPQSKIEKNADGKQVSFKEAWGAGFSSVPSEE